MRVDQPEGLSDRLSVTRMDLVPVVRTLVDSFGFVAHEKRIRLDLVALDVLDVCLDHDKVEKILFNLVDNALKYTPEDGEVQVVLSFGEEEKSVRMEVRDTGVGIPDDQRSKLFRRHERLDVAHR